MLTAAASPSRSFRSARENGDYPTTQRVVIVNGTGQTLDLADADLDTSRYDVVFVELLDHAYSQVKRVRPNLVILCLRLDDAEGFKVLSMLKLDPVTRGIPILTYTTEDDSPHSAIEAPESADTGGRMLPLTSPMN